MSDSNLSAIIISDGNSYQDIRVHHSCYSIKLGNQQSFSFRTRPTDKSAYWKIIFFISHPKICCGYSKEPSQCDGSFEHPKHMFKLMGKKVIKILHK